MALRNRDGTVPLGPMSRDWAPVADKRGNLQRAVRADLLTLFAEHKAAGTLPRSPRGAFYDLMPAGRGNGAKYVKPIKGETVRADRHSMTAHPDYVGDRLVVLRRQGLIPESWVADARAPDGVEWSGRTYGYPLSDVADGIVRNVDLGIDAYAIHRQERQAVYVELFVEAEGMMGRMRRVAGRYGVPIFSGSGYTGLKGVRRFAEDAAYRDVPTVVLVITDYDDDGKALGTRLADDATAWFDSGVYGERVGGGSGLAFVRIGITPEQAARYPDRVDALGHMQAEGMPVADMDAVVGSEIEKRLDVTRRDRVMAVGRGRRETLRDLVAASLRDRGD